MRGKGYDSLSQRREYTINGCACSKGSVGHNQQKYNTSVDVPRVGLERTLETQ
jgi:hypothetical protein